MEDVRERRWVGSKGALLPKLLLLTGVSLSKPILCWSLSRLSFRCNEG